MESNLIELVKENPDLPIFAWVYWEVVQDDGHSWLGQFNKAEIREYAKVEPFGNNEQTIVFKDDTEEYFEWLLENEFKDSGLYLTETEADKKIEHLNYKKAIFVVVDLPENI